MILGVAVPDKYLYHRFRHYPLHTDCVFFGIIIEINESRGSAFQDSGYWASFLDRAK